MAYKETTTAMIIDYFRKTKISVMMFHLFYVISICLTLSVTYTVAFHWGDVFSIYDQTHNQNSFSADLKTSVKADDEINDSLQKVLKKTGAMRAYMFRYHDGIGSVSGIQFFFESDTEEVISPGTTRLMQYDQNVPASVDWLMNSDFIHDKCAAIPNTIADPTSQSYFYMQSRSAEAVIRCPVFDDEGNLFGFVGLDFPMTLTDAQAQQYQNELSQTASQIEKIY